MKAQQHLLEMEPPWSRVLALALALSLGAALSLGLARFAYALLLTPMREAFGWSYAVAGSLNTANAVGYLVGALSAPLLARRWPTQHVFMAGAWGALLCLLVSPVSESIHAWWLLRFAAGVTSAWVFLLGGVLAARLGSWAHARPSLQTRSAFLVALFYAGTGAGIAASALVVPPVLRWASGAPLGLAAWAWGWLALTLLAAVSALVMRWPARVLGDAVHAVPTGASAAPRSWLELRFGLLAYLCFGLGYIGYMTFAVALLREQGAGDNEVLVFFGTLGLACMGSAWVWGRLLQHKNGLPMATLNALTGLATVLAALSHHPAVMLVSGVLFGGCFLQVVGSTTALVRHQWPQNQWARGIALFTTVFALGQIIGPLAVGVIADGPLGLRGGLLGSGAVLWLGAVLAVLQRGPIDHTI